jgi:hypothetical protein
MLCTCDAYFMIVSRSWTAFLPWLKIQFLCINALCNTEKPPSGAWKYHCQVHIVDPWDTCCTCMRVMQHVWGTKYQRDSSSVFAYARVRAQCHARELYARTRAWTLCICACLRIHTYMRTCRHANACAYIHAYINTELRYIVCACTLQRSIKQQRQVYVSMHVYVTYTFDMHVDIVCKYARISDCKETLKCTLSYYAWCFAWHSENLPWTKYLPKIPQMKVFHTMYMHAHTITFHS